jgi:hypothetical protein
VLEPDVQFHRLGESRGDWAAGAMTDRAHRTIHANLSLKNLSKGEIIDEHDLRVVKRRIGEGMKVFIWVHCRSSNRICTLDMTHKFERYILMRALT